MYRLSFFKDYNWNKLIYIKKQWLNVLEKAI